MYFVLYQYVKELCAPRRIQTYDLLIRNQLLYSLSYWSKFVENSGVEPLTPVQRAKASEWFHPEGVRGLWTPVPLCLGKRQDSDLRPSQYMAVPYALTS